MTSASLARARRARGKAWHSALNLSKPFSSRSRQSTVMCLSRSVAASPCRRVLPCLAGSRMVS